MTHKTLYCSLAVLVITALAACSHDENPEVLSQWQYEYDGTWHNATVPSCIHTDLMADSLIPDPFLGTNQDSVGWVAELQWRYRTTFTREQAKGKKYLLFESLQTYAAVLVNGDTLLHACNMFHPYSLRLSDITLRDTNTIEVVFDPVKVHDSLLAAQLPYTLPDRRAFSRNAPYQQGWDWGPVLPTVGIVGNVYLSRKAEPPMAPVAKSEFFAQHHITFEAKEDSTGLAYTFYDNGEPVFVKGANWIPVHSFPIDNATNRERYRYLLTQAKRQGINMIRVWGGGIYEQDYFFDLCDSLGLMVWMDFNYSCALYPSDSRFLDEAQAEAEWQVRRISRHPCVVLWCGNNEVENGFQDWGWPKQFDWDDETMAQLRHGIDTLFGEDGILHRAVIKYDPKRRPYVASSPLYGWGHPECCTHGDSHYWGVWWGELPFEVYKEKTGRFMSEYGFQSYPDYSTICRFCPEGERFIDSPTMKAHQKHGRGVEIIDKAMRQYYGIDSKTLNLEDYCYVSQLLQAWGMGYGILCHLQAQPRCMGTLYWQLNDCWPVASWSSIDYYGNLKALHYRAQALFSDSADLQVWEEYYKTYPKDLKLKREDYRMTYRATAEGLEVEIESDGYLRDVMLQTTPHIDGWWESNYFDLHEGDLVTIKFHPRNSNEVLSDVKVTMKCLNDIYYNLFLEEWNKHIIVCDVTPT
jgi:beta-mannosidase